MRIHMFKADDSIPRITSTPVGLWELFITNFHLSFVSRVLILLKLTKYQNDNQHSDVTRVWFGITSIFWGILCFSVRQSRPHGWHFLFLPPRRPLLYWRITAFSVYTATYCTGVCKGTGQTISLFTFFIWNVGLNEIKHINKSKANTQPNKTK